MAKTSSKTTRTTVKVSRTPIRPGSESVPPDGGWAWVVLIGTFIAAQNTMCALATFAVILNDLTSLLSTTTATLSWTPSVEISTGLFLGPLYTIIINKYGCRTATILGGILVSSGFMMSCFVTRVEILILVYGGVIGIGSGMCHLVYPVILSQYFKKYFGVAVGCLVASYASARLILTPLAQIILDEYGCRATMLLMGAVTLNICVGGCLYQPAKWHSVRVSTDINPTKNKTEEILQVAKDNTNSAENDEVKTRLLEGDGDVHPDINLNSPLEKYATSLECTTAIVPEDMERCSSEGPDNESYISTLCMKGPCSTIDHTLWKEPQFYIVSLSEVITVAVMVYSNVFLFPLGIEIGIQPMKTASVVSSKAIADMFGRLAGPSIVTLLKIPVTCSFIITNAVHAIILAAYMMVNSYEMYTSLSILSGFIYGIVVGLRNVLIVEVMGAERLSSVIGLSRFLQGFLLLPMAPTIGWIRDITGSFKEVFLFQSALEVVVVVLWILQPLITKRRK